MEGTNEPRRLTPEKQELAEKYLPLGRKFIKGYVEKFPWLQDELVSSVHLAFTEAALRWTPEHGVKFGTFALIQTKYRVLDTLRACCLKGFAPDEPQPAVYSCHELIPCYEFGARNPSNGHMVSEFLYDPEDPVGSYTDYQDQLAGWCRCLPLAHKRLIWGLYIFGWSQTEMAAKLGLSKSRVSYLHQEAIDLIRQSDKYRQEKEARCHTESIGKPSSVKFSTYSVRSKKPGSRAAGASTGSPRRTRKPSTGLTPAGLSPT